MKTICPETEQEITNLINTCVKEQLKLRVMGSGKSLPELFITDGYQLSLEKWKGVVSMNEEAKTVIVKSGTPIDELTSYLWEKGFTVMGIGTVRGMTIGGLISTGSHGMGLDYGNISSLVTGMKIIDGNGEVHLITKMNSPEAFFAFPVSLGCLGVITEIEIEIVPRFYLVENYKVTSIDLAIADSSAFIMKSGYHHLRFIPESNEARHFSLSRTESNDAATSCVRADEGFYKMNRQYWGNNRYGYFEKKVRSLKEKLKKKLSGLFLSNYSGEQVINLEYAVPLIYVTEALNRISAYFKTKHPRLQAEYGLRVSKADELWLSPSYQRDVCYLGCYLTGNTSLKPHAEKLEAILLEFEGRPHWGKYFTIEMQNFRTSYPKWDLFLKRRAEMDPHLIFENRWTRKLFATAQ